MQRSRLIGIRNALVDRAEREAAIQSRVAEWLIQADIHSIGFYFPIRNEPDLRGVIAHWLAQDARRVAALPVTHGPADRGVLEFHAWSTDSPMQAGPFGVPVPAQGRVRQPECLLIPCVGFDAKRFRIGYGAGYYDRTLANAVPWPLAVGIAFEPTRIESIEPQPHDVPLDVIITDAAQY